jgi:hypothetical protein
MEPAPKTSARPAPSRKTAALQEAFDETMDERAELLREANARRDMMLAQLKADDEALKKYIAMI